MDLGGLAATKAINLKCKRREKSANLNFGALGVSLKLFQGQHRKQRFKEKVIVLGRTQKTILIAQTPFSHVQFLIRIRMYNIAIVIINIRVYRNIKSSVGRFPARQ